MVGKVSPMPVKAMAALYASGEAEGLVVRTFCASAGVSPKTFYKWVDRARSEGLGGLEDRSRRPLRSPHMMGGDVEDEVVRLRKELIDTGTDSGATSIQSRLARDPLFAGRVPSVAGVHRALVRRGQVIPAPRKRPRSSYRRFEAGAPNERWQIDATDWMTAEGITRIFNIIDDHSRVAICCRAVPAATTEEAWATFGVGAAAWGLPTAVLSDNGLCFSGKLRGFEVFFEAQLRDAGIRPFCGSPYHPQTTGKVERFQQTLKRWLRARPLAANLAELQTQLDEFADFYNHQRPHQGIGRVTPIERFTATTPAEPGTQPLPHPTWPAHTHRADVDSGGVALLGRYKIHVGSEWQHHRATVLIAGYDATVFINGEIIRNFRIDPTRAYQGSGRKRGGPSKPRIP
jgi:transposase InsO family protein/transposase-like protein